MSGRELLENAEVYIVIALYTVGAIIITLSVVQRSVRTESVGFLVLGLSYLYEWLLIHNAKQRQGGGYGFRIVIPRLRLTPSGG